MNISTVEQRDKICQQPDDANLENSNHALCRSKIPIPKTHVWFRRSHSYRPVEVRPPHTR